MFEDLIKNKKIIIRNIIEDLNQKRIDKEDESKKAKRYLFGSRSCDNK